MIYFPNPVSDVLNVFYRSDERRIIDITLSDITGKIVYIQNKQLNIGENNISIDVIHWEVEFISSV
ncbi:MAG: T9SS type A sorting domain-containing protein [Bacteroidetes bacterium]|nr:T9SS type A sorting domain-containing protein [Bacteroidota bacterium]